MGEVRVKVKLINAGDETLVRRGLLASDQVRTYEGEALIDTGAVASVLPYTVTQQLGVSTVRYERARYANATEERCAGFGKRRRRIGRAAHHRRNVRLRRRSSHRADHLGKVRFAGRLQQSPPVASSSARVDYENQVISRKK